MGMKDPDPQPVPSLVMNFSVCLDTQNVLFSTTYQTTEIDSDERKRKKRPQVLVYSKEKLSLWEVSQ